MFYDMKFHISVVKVLVLLILVNVNIGDKSMSKSLTKRRIMSEWRDVVRDNLSLSTPFNTTSTDDCEVRLAPLGNDYLQWHFSFTGVAGSAYEGGCYHGRIILPPEYPRKAPSISVMTPNGRWEVCKDICLSASAYHQETWDLNWNLRTLVMALRGHMLTQPREIGAISTTPDRQKQLATMSRYYKCKECGVSHLQLLGMMPMTPTTLNTKGTTKIITKKQSQLLSRKVQTKSNQVTNTNNKQSKSTEKSSSSSSISSSIHIMFMATKSVLLFVLPIVLFIFHQYTLT